jgi:hypothetical protein
MSKGGDLLEAYWRARDARLALDAYNAAVAACNSYPQGGACNSVDKFRAEWLKCTGSTVAGAGPLPFTTDPRVPDPIKGAEDFARGLKGNLPPE